MVVVNVSASTFSGFGFSHLTPYTPYCKGSHSTNGLRNFGGRHLHTTPLGNRMHNIVAMHALMNHDVHVCKLGALFGRANSLE